MKMPYYALLAVWGKQLMRYGYLCRLNRPADLALFLLPAGWASLLAADGHPSGGHLTALLLAATLMRCAAWVFNDWMEARLLPEGTESYLGRGRVTLREVQLLLATLLLVSLLLLLPLPATLFYYAWPAPLLLIGYPFLKTRILLIQPYLGLCYAWLVPLAYAAQGRQPDKAGWLLFTATLFFTSAFAMLYALPRRDYELRVGIRSLAQLFGTNSWFFVMAMQLSAVFSLWLAGRQLDLGIFFSLGLIVMTLLVPYQLWLLFSHPLEGSLRSYRSQIWSAIAILCGIAFHYLCICSPTG
jgi:4-hydroxybenzoate polyprenyltransferase